MIETANTAAPTHTRQRRWYQFRLRTLLVFVSLLAILFSYVGNYYRLSRRGMREARVYGLAGFLYVPFKEAAATEDLSRHYRLAAFYAPVNWVDREFFGGEYPTGGIMWRLGP